MGPPFGGFLPDLVKIRWHGPARVVMREDKDGRPDVYWLAYKTQLIRCAPHHVRSDYMNNSKTQIEDAKNALKEVQQLRSRGVTRFLDLNKINKQNILDVDEEDMGPEMDLEEADALQPPLRRRRLDEDPQSPGGPGFVPLVPPDDVEPSPTSGTNATTR